MAHKLISKAEAKKLGLPTYDDTPCSKCGHSRRYTNSGKCVDCHTERNKRRNRSKTGNATKSKAVAVAPEPLNGDWRFYSDRITTAWQKAVASILETGKLLIEAKAKVKRGDWGKLVAELPFGERTAERLMEIARHRILSDPTHGSVLPPSWRTLYELTKLPAPVLLAKIEEGSINPEMERSDVEVIAASFTKKASDAALAGALAAGKVHHTPGRHTAVEIEVKTSEPKATEVEWPKSLPESSSRATEAEIIEVTPPTAVATEPERDHLGRTYDEKRWIENHLMRSIHEIDVGGFSDRPIEELAAMIAESGLPLIEKVAAFLTKLADAMRRKAAA